MQRGKGLLYSQSTYLYIPGNYKPPSVVYKEAKDDSIVNWPTSISLFDNKPPSVVYKEAKDGSIVHWPTSISLFDNKPPSGVYKEAKDGSIVFFNDCFYLFKLGLWS